MPRMSKKRKQDLAFFLNERGRIPHNEICRKCIGDCKQSFRTAVICCLCYESNLAMHLMNYVHSIMAVAV